MADFPEPGIQFKDLSPLFADARGFAAVTDALAAVASGSDFWWPASTPAASCSRRRRRPALGTGVLAVRKGGKLPPPVHSESYNLEYGTATLEIPAEGIEIAGRTIVIIDDVLATGGTRRGHGAAAGQGGRNGDRRRGGAGIGRPGRPRRAQTATGQQLAHRLSDILEVWREAMSACAKSRRGGDHG